jgi:hypothetical protein
MAENQLRMFGEIRFYAIPVPLIIADIFTKRADRQHALKGFDFIQCLL